MSFVLSERNKFILYVIMSAAVIEAFWGLTDPEMAWCAGITFALGIIVTFGLALRFDLAGRRPAFRFSLGGFQLAANPGQRFLRLLGFWLPMGFLLILFFSLAWPPALVWMLVGGLIILGLVSVKQFFVLHSSIQVWLKEPARH